MIDGIQFQEQAGLFFECQYLHGLGLNANIFVKATHVPGFFHFTKKSCVVVRTAGSDGVCVCSGWRRRGRGVRSGGGSSARCDTVSLR